MLNLTDKKLIEHLFKVDFENIFFFFKKGKYSWTTGRKKYKIYTKRNIVIQRTIKLGTKL